MIRGIEAQVMSPNLSAALLLSAVLGLLPGCESPPPARMQRSPRAEVFRRVATGEGRAAPVRGSGGAGEVPPTPSAFGPAQPRVVAIGDLHSDIGSTRKAFQLAGATDENDEWIGGELRIVQLGDMIGRSDDERQVLDFLFDVRQKAEAFGGRVHLLVGNHEVMGGRVDNQAVGSNPFPGYEDLVDLSLDDPRLLILPEAQKKRGAALMSGGPYAKRFAQLPTVFQLGETVFVHGGVVPRWAEYGLDKINAEVSHWLFGAGAEPDCSLGVDNGDRVMWTRQFSSAVDVADCDLLDQSLAILGAKRMIVAHTVQTTISSYCDGKVWAVDVGMSRFYGGPIEVLEIVDDETLTVLRQ
jgi:hypothetical protein